MGTLLHWCFDDRSTTPPEGSSATSGVLGVPPSALNPSMPQMLFGAQVASLLFSQSHRLHAPPRLRGLGWLGVGPGLEFLGP